MTKLSTNKNASALDMAQAMFGDGITIVSAQYTGDKSSSATYSGGLETSPDAVPADTGVILSTGKVSDFTSGQKTNFNTSTSTSTNTKGVDGDADLGALIGRHTYDGAIFEAEFESAGDTLSMQLVFGSEEYLEWVDSGYNDVVGIWVNGVKAEMTIGEGDISIDNINPGSNANLFLDNSEDLYNTEMDGLTKVLTVKAPVLTQGTNTIKIAIADDGDSVYDSNLLIVGDSVQSAVIAKDDTVLLSRNETKVFDLLANDIVPDGETIQLIKINDVEVKSGETVTLDTGETLTLNADNTVSISAAPANGSNTLNYTITSGSGTSDVAFLTIVTSPVDGTEGNDKMLAGYTDAEGNMVDGTDGHDDVVMGYGGNDKIFAGAGNDEIWGGSGNDNLRGGAGDDLLYGGTGNDLLTGSEGADTVYGGAGNDAYWVDQADDVLVEFANERTDKVRSTTDWTLGEHFENLYLEDVSRGGEGVQATGNALNNFIGGNSLDNVIHGGGGKDRLVGKAGDDTIDGGAGRDDINGDQGDDLLRGGEDKDKIRAGSGQDTLEGGTGDDVLIAGAGADTFVFSTGDGNDVVFGFKRGEDFIQIADVAFDQLTLKKKGTGTEIKYGSSDSIYVPKTDGEMLTEADFIFA